jgi:type I restriction enzyme, S subunit
MLTLAGAGATRRALTKEMIQNLRVPFPPLADQRAIGSFLGSLDDKIELNRRMNSTLEQIAQGLFKSWFVDFNPVRAKREGRWKKGESLPGMPADMWDLWPSEFEDSELGEIPTGWTVLSLASVGCFLNGLACQRYPPKGQEWLPVLKIAELRAGSVKGADHASTSVPPEYVVDDGDLVFSWSGSLEVRFWHGGKAVLNQHLFKITSDRFPLWFCYGWILEHIDEFRAIASDKATTMGHIQRHHLQDALIAVPPPNIVAACDRMMAPEIEAITSNESQVRTLALLRDTLLPKLLSGEIRVPIDVG